MDPKVVRALRSHLELLPLLEFAERHLHIPQRQCLTAPLQDSSATDEFGDFLRSLAVGLPRSANFPELLASDRTVRATNDDLDHDALIQRIVADLLRAARTSPQEANVLSYGSRPSGSGDNVPLDVFNSSRTLLHSYFFRLLASRLPPGWFYSLMSYCSVFQVLPGKSLFQISGPDAIAQINNKKNRLGADDRLKRRTERGRTLLTQSAKLKITGRSKFYGRPHLDSMGKPIFGFKPPFCLHLAKIRDFNTADCHNCVAQIIIQQVFPAEYHLPFPSQPTPATSSKLLKDPPAVPRRLVSIHRILESVLRKHRNLPYHHYMELSCPVPPDLSDVSQMDPIASFHLVTKFCNLVIENMFPRDLFGSAANWAKIRSYVADYIRLKKGESISLHQLVQGIKISEVLWLGPTSSKLALGEFQKRQNLLVQLLFWFFDKMLRSLVRTNFYVTERSGAVTSAYYYRHDVWQTIYKQTVKSYVDRRLTRIPRREERRIVAESNLGFAGIRLIPKGTGFRTVTTLGRRPLARNGKPLDSVNSKLTELHRVLTDQARLTGRIGRFSIRNIYEVFPKLAKLKENTTLDQSNAKFYFVKVDIAQCFDQIDREAAFKLASKLISTPRYWLQQVQASNYRLNTRKYKGSLRFTSRNFMSDTFDIVSPNSPVATGGGQILIDKAKGRVVEGLKLKNQLDELLHGCLVEVDGHKYFQDEGIPQGSKLSSLLCELVLEDLIGTHLMFDESKSVLFRYVDDFLFVTSSLSLAEKFTRRMSMGFPEYGAYINPAKTVTNFTPGFRCPNANVVLSGRIRFLGWDVNCQTLDPVYVPVTSVANTRGLPSNVLVKQTYSDLSKFLRYKLHFSIVSHSFNNKEALLSYIRSMALDFGRHIRAFSKRNRALNLRKTIDIWIARIVHTVTRRFLKTSNSRTMVTQARQTCHEGFKHALFRLSDM